MKRKYLLILLLFLTIILAACGPKTEDEETSVLDTVRSEMVVPEEIGDYQFPTELNGVTITWSSNIVGTLTDDYKTVQGEHNQSVSITASFSYEGTVRTKLYNTVILADPALNQDAEVIQATKDALTLPLETNDDLDLITASGEVSITWVSSDTQHITTTGIITRPEDGEGDAVVTLTATLTLNDETLTKTFTITVLEATLSVEYTGYYAGADGLEGEVLKTFLHELIDDHTELSYDDLRQALQVTDEDPQNPDNVILIYTGDSVPSTWDYGATWNREHVWPRSLGDMDRGDAEHNDMHHVRPSHPSVNSSRGNLDFDEGGSLVGNTDDCYRDSDSFEPRDEVKGDVARMIFYMAVRYEGGGGEIDLEINEYVNNDAPNIGVLSVLIEWHLNDLPDAFEINRNDLIFGYQGNRNPFIDHPEFVELIWGTN